jgi:hypothetical protein
MKSPKLVDKVTMLSPLSEAEVAAIEGGSWLSNLIHHVPINVEIFPRFGHIGFGKIEIPKIPPLY